MRALHAGGQRAHGAVQELALSARVLALSARVLAMVPDGMLNVCAAALRRQELGNGTAEGLPVRTWCAYA